VIVSDRAFRRLAMPSMVMRKNDDWLVDDRLAKAQAWLHISGAIAFPIGIAVVTTQGEKLVITAILGSPVVVEAVLLSAVIVFRTSKA
jgi:hypothetical protein